MKRLADDTEKTSGSAFLSLQSAQQQHHHKRPRKLPPRTQRPNWHHIGLYGVPPAGRDDNSSAQQPHSIVRTALAQWIIDCDPGLLLAPDGQMARYGRYGQTLAGDALCQRVKPDDALNYYRRWPDELPQDMLLCHQVCPVFVLHGLVNLLRNDADLYHAPQETLLVLHVLKRYLRLADDGAKMVPFLKRLFSLAVYSLDGYTHNHSDSDAAIMRRYEHYWTVAIAMLTSNVDFMIPVQRHDENAVATTTTTRYRFAVYDVKQRGALQRLIAQNLSLARHGGSNSSRWTRTYLQLQIEIHCRGIRSRWAQSLDVPRPLVLDVPSYDIIDINHLISVVLANPVTARYGAAVVRMVYGGDKS